eukprot:396589_1
MPRKKSAKLPLCIEPIPETSQYDSQIIDFETTQSAFKNFRQKWVVPFTKKKERLGGYTYKKNVSKWCCDKFDQRKTLEALKNMADGQHYELHKKDKNAFKKETEFVYLLNLCEMRDGNDEKRMLLWGEKK